MIVYIFEPNCQVKYEKRGQPLYNVQDRIGGIYSSKEVPRFLAGVSVLENDQVEWFVRPEKLVSYAGLVPSTYASGGKVYNGPLIKQSNRWLRWAMVEASWSAQRSSPYFQSYYRKHLYKGHNRAIVALARRMLEIL